MDSAIHIQFISAYQKNHQSNLEETLVLISLLTGLVTRIGQVVRSSYPTDILTAIQ